MYLKVTMARGPALLLALALMTVSSCNSGGTSGIPTDPGTTSARERNSGDFGPGAIVSFTAPIPGASVKPGGRVIWTNNTGMIHTVTSN